MKIVTSWRKHWCLAWRFLAPDYESDKSARAVYQNRTHV